MLPKCEGMLLTNSKREAVKHISFSFTIGTIKSWSLRGQREILMKIFVQLFMLLIDHGLVLGHQILGLDVDPEAGGVDHL